MSEKKDFSLSYSQAGVDLDAAHDVVNRYKESVSSTKIPGVLGELGGFGGLFSLRDAITDLEDPILVSGTDGVGTKLKLAFQLNRHDTIGIDLVAMCVNDIVTTGAKPLFFLDYLATGKLFPEQAASIVDGIATGCKLANCALIGGETAEMPGFYQPSEYDVAGFAVGVVERKKLLSVDSVKEGDLLVGIASSGFHSNGYSLVRKIIEDNDLELDVKVGNLGKTLGELLLEPTYIYTPLALDLVANGAKSMAHITGGGFYENVLRALPKGLGVKIDPLSWTPPLVINFICQIGKIPVRERYTVFNMGIGLIAIISPNDREKILEVAKAHRFEASIIGTVEGNEVHLIGIDEE